MKLLPHLKVMHDFEMHYLSPSTKKLQIDTILKLENYLKATQLEHCPTSYKKFYNHTITNKIWKLSTASVKMRIIHTIINNLVKNNYIDKGYLFKNDYQTTLVPKHIELPPLSSVFRIFEEEPVTDSLYLVQIIMATGLRVHELKALKYSKLDTLTVKQQLIMRCLVENKKARRHSEVFFLPIANKALQTRRDSTKRDEFFSDMSDRTVYNLVMKATEWFFCKKYSPTDCRKIFAYLLNYYGLDILEKQRFMRHSDYRTTLQYYDGDKSLSGIKKIIEKSYQQVC